MLMRPIFFVFLFVSLQLRPRYSVLHSWSTRLAANAESWLEKHSGSFASRRLEMSSENSESTKSNRITMAMVWEEFRSFFSLEKGALFTTLQLLRRPGETIRSYLGGSRKKLTNPIRYLAMATAFVTLGYVTLMPREQFVDNVEQGMGMGGGAETLEPEDTIDTSTVQELLSTLETEADDPFQVAKIREAKKILGESVQERVAEISLTWMNVFLLCALPINTLLSWLAFRKAKHNIAEHVAINSYVLGFQNLLAIVFLPPSVLHSPELWSLIYLACSYFYQVTAWRQTFQLKGLGGNLLCLLLVLVCTILYVVIQFLVTILVLQLTQ